MKAWFKEQKTTLACNRCAENHPACLQFHHKDPGEKTVNLGRAVARGWGPARILEEMAKCEILCANCHAKEHLGQFFFN